MHASDARGCDSNLSMAEPTYQLPPLPDAPRDIVMFVAMEREAAPIAAALKLGAAQALAARSSARIRRGEIAGVRISLITPGVDSATGVDKIGPLHASMALHRALHATPCDLLLNAGTAGGFESRGSAIADIVVAHECMIHDARVQISGFDTHCRSHTKLSPDDAMLARLCRTLSARAGLVSTGSSLDATADELACFAATETLAQDMELAALAVVAHELGLPLAAIKGVTDFVDHHEPTQDAFLRNLQRTSNAVAAATGPLIETLARLRG